MTNPWPFISEHLADTVTFMVVVHDQGSAPGKRGFKMAVADASTSLGTIGGGIMEFNLVTEAATANQAGTPRAPFLVERVHRKNAPETARSGMICAGAQTIAVVTLTEADRDLVDRLCRKTGRLVITPKGLSLDQTPTTGPTFTPGPSWSYSEPHGHDDTVYVIGGGHVGAALCRALSLLNFQVTVFDHRPDLAVFKAIDTAHKIVVTDYHQIHEHIKEGDHSFVAIVTTGFDTDAHALTAVANKNLRYLGLMGSAAKLKAIFTYAREQGVTTSQLDRVYAPIGLNIKNQTPMEIAFSIAGQIIDIRNSTQK